MTDFNDRREDRTRDWRVGVVREFLSQQAATAAAAEPFVANYPNKFIPTSKQVAKADKAQQKRRKRQGLY